jgi:peptidoglycan/xylan/chitin deacetylase (PgdA/CDA1 family)
VKVPLPLIRLPLWVAAAIIVVTPFTVAWRIYVQPAVSEVGVQYDAPPSASTVDDLTTWRAMAVDLPARAAPVVLAYHDIRPGSTDLYTVSPVEFDNQLTALSTAGYTTLTSAEFVDYLRGGPVPPRSVYLTFDDGTSGLYAYADRILARHGMHGASYLISGRVGKYRPYYLTWREVAEMAASGRWDFQAHTHDLHTRGAVGPRKINGSLLTGSMWPSPDRMESVEEHRVRVGNDLRAMFADFADHALPTPEVFAYPFSDANLDYDRGAVDVTQKMIRDEFVAALTNKVREPTPVSRRSTAGELFERIEVFSSTRATDLLAQVTAWTAIAPRVGDVLADGPRWWDARTRSVADLSILDGSNPGATDASSYLSAYYAPYATADWIGYTITADVRGLQRGGNNGNLLVRVGSAAETAVRVSCCGLQLASTRTGRVLAQQRLRLAESHHVSVSVRDGWTVVTVDGEVRVRVRVERGTGSTGGIGLASRRGPAADWPYFARVAVVPR